MKRFAKILMAALAAWVGSASGDEVAARTLAVGDRVTLAGELDPGAVAALKAEDALVVDLRRAEEGSHAERDLMARSGVRYVHLPTDGAVPEPAHVAQLDAILQGNADRPVVIHCRSGNRAALMWSARLLDQGVSLDEALGAVDGIVTSDRIRESIRGYSERLTTTP